MDGQQAVDECPRCRELESRVRALEEQVRRLTAALEEAQRAGKRQAAPFRKGKQIAVPKKPGRKSGEDYGKHARRTPPDNPPVIEECVAELPPQCPHCNSTNVASCDATDEQFQTEIQCRTIRRRFVIHRGCCLDCGAPLEGRHPLQTSTATGAAREQLGAQAHALMSVLNKQMGLSHGKIAWLFDKVFRLKISRSTSVRSVERTGRRCEPAYEQIRQDVRAAEQVTPDETGWRVGGHKAWLHAFATPRTTCYDIDPTRSMAPAQRLLGLDWSGWLVQGRFTHQGNRRLAKFVAGHLEEIFAYLWHPGMDAANYQGEQSIRPAVVNRKVWGGNRTWVGARAQAVLTSVIRTCLQRRIDILDFLVQSLTHPNPILIPP